MKQPYMNPRDKLATNFTDSVSPMRCYSYIKAAKIHNVPAVRGSNPGGGEIFYTRPDRPWGPASLLYNGYRVFPGGKAAGAWRLPPTPSSAEVKERVQLYIYSTSGPSWPVLG